LKKKLGMVRDRWGLLCAIGSYFLKEVIEDDSLFGGLPDAAYIAFQVATPVGVAAQKREVLREFNAWSLGLAEKQNWDNEQMTVVGYVPSFSDPWPLGEAWQTGTWELHGCFKL